jgi:hypothetical protein
MGRGWRRGPPAVNWSVLGGSATEVCVELQLGHGAVAELAKLFAGAKRDSKKTLSEMCDSRSHCVLKDFR